MFAFMFYIHKLSYIMKREISSPTFQYGKVYGFRHLHLIYKLKDVYCILKIPTIAEGNPESCMRNFPIIADAFGISLSPQQML